METLKILAKLGLKHPEDKIYLALLDSHRASVAQLARETDTERPTVYRALPSLISKGLVGKVNIGKRIMYVAENPITLSSFADELKSNLEEMLPELIRRYDGSKKKPIVKYFEGKDGIKHVYDEMIRKLKKGDAIYRYESPKNFKVLKNYFPPIYYERATGPEGQFEKYVITNSATVGKRNERLWRHTKSIPADYDTFDHNITQLIYKDRVAFIDYDTETATVIENQRFADFQLKIFRLLFGKL